MKIFIKVSPSAKHERIEKMDSFSKNHYAVWVKEPPVKGMANQAVVRALAEYFKTSLLKIKIISGFSSRQKIVEIQR